MGNCSSCLGRARKDSVDEDEESQLLFNDPNNLQYGSFGDQYLNGQEDPMEAQRESEALQRVVAKASDNMVDVFEIAPSEDATPRAPPTPFGYAGQEARIERYQHLLARLSAAPNGEAETHVDWQEEETIELQRAEDLQPKVEPNMVLVGTFADAAAAMA